MDASFGSVTILTSLRAMTQQSRVQAGEAGPREPLGSERGFACLIAANTGSIHHNADGAHPECLANSP